MLVCLTGNPLITLMTCHSHPASSDPHQHDVKEKKWLGVPRCLTSTALYGDCLLRLPFTSLTEEFKCAKIRLQVTLTESKDLMVSKNAPAIIAGRKWRQVQAVEEAVAALKHADIVGYVQHGRGGLGLTAQRPAWSKASAAERRRMIMDEVKNQEEGIRRAKMVALEVHVSACLWQWGRGQAPVYDRRAEPGKVSGRTTVHLTVINLCLCVFPVTAPYLRRQRGELIPGLEHSTRFSQE
ncbi:phosphatidylinositol-glycan biosynthesis class X protein isoform X1 [Neoarius graeffei]|uniref:phosphatidylinositol-glycan biosynthesis class X protein isoform X1 n=1 Tax=Neoarius graeffei TaxID=443677 RepID=UPI00298CA59A|nr:phosphatidylinositol-glycan biosynthesis class X protein isoform X1 [Neoarius graeffei]